MTVERHSPWNKHANDARAAARALNLTDTDGFQYWGEVHLLEKVLLFFGFMLMICYCGFRIQKCQKQQEERERNARSILSDTDEGASRGIEMSEMNPAAEAAAMAEEGGSSNLTLESGDAPQEGMDGVRHELNKMRMGQYARAFEANGYDHWPEILRLPPHRCAKLIGVVGMSTNHADRFKEQLRDQRRRLKIHQVMPNGGQVDAAEEACVIL